MFTNLIGLDAKVSSGLPEPDRFLNTERSEYPDIDIDLNGDYDAFKDYARGQFGAACGVQSE